MAGDNYLDLLAVRSVSAGSGAELGSARVLP